MDRPTTGKHGPSEPFKALDKVFEFIEQHNWKLFHFASLAFGFLIFLIYFGQNHFYPDFDLFGFVSLLAAAASWGASSCCLLALALPPPGGSGQKYSSATNPCMKS